MLIIWIFAIIIFCTLIGVPLGIIGIFAQAKLDEMERQIEFEDRQKEDFYGKNN